MAQLPIAITHLGSGICSYSSRIGSAIFFTTVPATIITSDCRGDGHVTTPKRSKSWFAMYVDIISIAQHASPNVSGHSEFLRASASRSSIRAVTTPGVALRYGAAGATLPSAVSFGGRSRLLFRCHFSYHPGTTGLMPQDGFSFSTATAAPPCATRTARRRAGWR